MLAKSIGVYIVARLFRINHREAIWRGTLVMQGGEFAFVLYAAAAGVRLFDPTTTAILTAAVVISMALTPLGVLALRWLLPEDEQSMDGVEAAEELHGSALIIGFGRFGQVASQNLLARGIDVSIIDIDTEMIRTAAEFGFKVYYGDGCRLDMLHAAGAGEAKAILVCVDKRDAADRVVALAKAEFPLAKLLVRSYDRGHALRLVEAGVDLQVRETFESALKFGELALRELGVREDEAAETAADIRRRDAERFALEQTGGLLAGRDLLHGNAPRPVPFTKPKALPRPSSTSSVDNMGR
jgi:glutathione-regulated potassium-efflux system protein KefB